MKYSFKLVSILLALILLTTGCFQAATPEEDISISENTVPSGVPDSSKTLIMQGINDTQVIPDKFNTGVTDEALLTKVTSSGMIEGLNFKSSSEADSLALDLFYSNKTIEDTVIVKNIDFSDFKIIFLNDSKITTAKTIRFVNCKFSIITSGRADSLVKYEFENSTIGSFSGSNATFNKCKFGGTNFDALNPLRNVTMIDSFISDLAHPLSTRVLHSDGTQIFGYKDLDVANIYYKNCRFEVPDIPFSVNNGVYVNSAISVALEYSNGTNLVFEDCIINGGGYSIYATAKNKSFKLDNISFKNIQIGSSKRWGNIYYDTADTVKLDNVRNTSSLYIGSVWKDSNGIIHMSVTNDTNTPRLLIVNTENGTKEFQIPANPNFSDLVVDKSKFSDFPYDIDLTISNNSNWIVCYDTSVSTSNQIRFFNWSNSPVYISTPVDQKLLATLEQSAPLFSAESSLSDSKSVASLSAAITEGNCGPNVTYSLTSDGSLTLKGSGSTFNYSSTVTPPWYDLRETITSVTIESGITVLGSQLFRNSTNLIKVDLSDTLTEIGPNAFINCSSLNTISIPKSLLAISKYAFTRTSLNTVIYQGTEIAWNSISIALYNDPILNANKVFATTPVIIREIRDQGTSGTSTTWILYKDGELVLEGEGITNNYNSIKTSPWYNYSNEITSLTLKEGITKLGDQLFRNCKNISTVSLPESITTIGANVFIGCSSLTSLSIGRNLTTVDKNATLGTSITTVTYSGTKEEWNKISLGYNNEALRTATVTYKAQ